MSLELIFEAIKDKKCLPFLGAGASAGYRVGDKEIPGAPLGGRLAEALAAACDYRNGSTYDLARVAEYFVFKKSGRRDELESSVRAEIRKATHPRPIHTALAQLHQVRFVLTSNYDELLETECNRYQRDLIKHYYDRTKPTNGHFDCDLSFGPPGVVLHKMHGTAEEPHSMVITQSDYIRYLANLNDPDRGMPDVIRKYTIPYCNLLFLGYSLEDWNFRVIWEGVLASYRDKAVGLKSYALLKNPTEFQRDFWWERKVKLIDCDLTDFAVKLAEEFKLDLPQLGIVKGAQVQNGEAER